MYFVTDFIIETPTFLLLASTWFYKLFSLPEFTPRDSFLRINRNISSTWWAIY
jgi:hypothetical protein